MNIKNNIIFHFTFFAALLFLAKPAQALPTQDSLFRPNHYSFDITTTFYPAQKVLMPTGDASMAFKPAVFLQAGFTYSRFWKNGLGVKVGGRWGIIPLAVKFNYPNSYQGGDPPGPFFWYNYVQFPLCAAYRIHFKNNFNLEFSTGVALELVFPTEGNIGVGPGPGIEDDFWEMSVQNNSKAAFLDIPFEITASKVFNHKHELNFGLTYSLPIGAVGNGQYNFYLPNGDNSSGSFNVRNTYVGIKVGYTFLGNPLFGKEAKASRNVEHERVIEDTALLAKRKLQASDASFRPNHFGIYVTNTWYPAPKFIQLSGDKIWRQLPTTFLQGGLAYSRFWENGLGVKVAGAWGIETVAIPIYPPPDVVQRSFFLWFIYYEFPVCGVYRVHFKENYNLEFSTGIALDVIIANNGDESIGYGSNEVAVNYQTNANPNAAEDLILGIPLEITASKVFNRMHEIDFGLNSCIALHSFGSGQYSSSGGGADYTGKIIFRNTYIGIKVGYTYLGKAWFKKRKKTSEPYWK